MKFIKVQIFRRLDADISAGQSENRNRKNTKSETVVNRIYQEMAQHYDTAVIPARIRKPKDKPTVEGNVGNISAYILAACRGQQFLSLQELNAEIKKKCNW